VAGRYLRGLAQAAECTFAAMATVVDASCAQQFQHFDPKAVVRKSARTPTTCWAASRPAA